MSDYANTDYPVGAPVVIHAPGRNIPATIIGYPDSAPGYVQLGWDYMPDEDRYTKTMTMHMHFVEVQR